MIFYLSRYQKIEITVITLLSMFLIFLFRPIILGYKPESNDIIIFSLLIFIWLGLSKIFTNLIISRDTDNQLSFEC